MYRLYTFWLTGEHVKELFYRRVATWPHGHNQMNEFQQRLLSSKIILISRDIFYKPACSNFSIVGLSEYVFSPILPRRQARRTGIEAKSTSGFYTLPTTSPSLDCKQTNTQNLMHFSVSLSAKVAVQWRRPRSHTQPVAVVLSRYYLFAGLGLFLQMLKCNCWRIFEKAKWNNKIFIYYLLIWLHNVLLCSTSIGVTFVSRQNRIRTP